MKEFFGIGGYAREPEGYLSPQHLLFVTSLVAIMVLLAIVLGVRNKNREYVQKNRVIVVSAILINSVEIFKIVILCIRNEDPVHWIYELPLFLCSIQLLALPIAAFTNGRIKDAAIDFVFIFGLLGALLGTYGAGNNYAAFPVLSIDNVASGITHTISGFASLYIAISGMSSMKKRNIPITLSIIALFCTLAYTANVIIDYNYMFLMSADGTPYQIIYDLWGGHPVLYPISVVALFVIYISLFYALYYLITKKLSKRA